MNIKLQSTGIKTQENPINYLKFNFYNNLNTINN